MKREALSKDVEECNQDMITDAERKRFARPIRITGEAGQEKRIKAATIRPRSQAGRRVHARSIVDPLCMQGIDDDDHEEDTGRLSAVGADTSTEHPGHPDDFQRSPGTVAQIHDRRLPTDGTLPA